ncbi:MAG: hypothetical protein ABL888_00020 [Pirellulaceae bacterium]
MMKLYLIFSAAVAALFMTLPTPQEPLSTPRAPAQASAPAAVIAPVQYPSRALFGSTQDSNTIAVAGFYEQRPGEMSKAMQTYRDAKSDEDKATARDEIKVQLAKQYDELLANQEHQIKELEDRIAKLKDQLSRRRDAKEKMVNLKLEMVLSQADGLGWPDNDHSARSPFGVNVVRPPNPAGWSDANSVEQRAVEERYREDQDRAERRTRTK